MVGTTFLFQIKHQNVFSIYYGKNYQYRYTYILFEFLNRKMEDADWLQQLAEVKRLLLVCE